MSFGVCHGDRGRFRVQPDDGADALVQLFIDEANGVVDKELFSLCKRWWCRFGMNRGGRAIGNDRLCVSKLYDRALRRRSQRIVADITDGHSEVQALTYFRMRRGSSSIFPMAR